MGLKSIAELESFRKEELAKISAKYGVGGDGDDYDPHQFRDAVHGTNYGETLVHVLKASLGTGILAMPQAFKYAGLINGIIFTIVISGVCVYGIHILISSQYKLCKKLKVPYLTYAVAMKASLLDGPMWLTKYAYMSQVMIDAFLIVYQIGASASYVVFVAENLKRLISLSGDTPIEWYILITVVPFLLIMAIPTMKWLAPFSLLSNVLSVITFGILLQHIFTGLEPFQRMNYFGPVKDFPLFMGIVLFAVAAMGAVTVVEKNMKTPSQFIAPCGVINVSMAIITVLYTIMGVFGYWRHPDDIQPSITLNLDHDVKGQLAQGLYTIAIYITYSLNAMVLYDIIWNTYLLPYFANSPNLWTWDYFVRSLIVLATIVLASWVPLLSEIYSLFGAFCMPGLEIIFPAIIHLCVCWPNDLGWGKWVLISDLIMMLLGIIGFLSGTYSSMRSIVIKLSKQ